MAVLCRMSAVDVRGGIRQHAPMEGVTIRRAGMGDVANIARVRATSFGSHEEHGWFKSSVATILAEHLAVGDFVCFIAEDAEGQVVAYGVGMIHQRLPALHNPSGRWGYVQSMETHPDYRGRGFGTAILRRILEWYESIDVPAAMLVSSDVAEGLYRRAGFADDPFGLPLVWIRGVTDAQGP